jgi:hypothetical protein
MRNRSRTAKAMNLLGTLLNAWFASITVLDLTSSGLPLATELLLSLIPTVGTVLIVAGAIADR